MPDSVFRVALVTGASAGLGARFAEALDRAGASVVVTALRAGELDALAERLSHSLAGQTLLVDGGWTTY
jgi:NADP-dependent 3-hydroxy acid dehydrogenase YdfG